MADGQCQMADGQGGVASAQWPVASEGKCQMADGQEEVACGEWRVASDGECQMAEGECQMADDKCQMADSECQMADGGIAMADDKCQMADPIPHSEFRIPHSDVVAGGAKTPQKAPNEANLRRVNGSSTVDAINGLKRLCRPARAAGRLGATRVLPEPRPLLRTSSLASKGRRSLPRNPADRRARGRNRGPNARWSSWRQRSCYRSESQRLLAHLHGKTVAASRDHACEGMVQTGQSPASGVSPIPCRMNTHE